MCLVVYLMFLRCFYKAEPFECDHIKDYVFLCVCLHSSNKSQTSNVLFSFYWLSFQCTVLGVVQMKLIFLITAFVVQP